MNFLQLFVAVLSVCLQVIPSNSALTCHNCSPILQTGEDCANVRSDQLQVCDGNQDICRTTAVSLPGANGVRTPTINRGCAASTEYSSNQAGFLQVGTQKCVITSEGQRISKLCLCNYNGCNGLTMGQLVDNSAMMGSSTAFTLHPSSTNVMAYVLLLLCFTVLRVLNIE